MTSNPGPPGRIKKMPRCHKMDAEDLTGREVIAYLADYLSRELPARERALFEAHLALSPECVTCLGTYEETTRLGRCMGDNGEEPPAPPEELIAAILHSRRA